MNKKTETTKRTFAEFVAIVALLTSLAALAIDAMLPALTQIGADLGVKDPNDNQLVISFIFIGLALGQILYGPLSDSFGRKSMIFAGLLIFMTGCFFSIFATEFSTMLLGRFLQGLGAASPKIVVVALVRDQYEGRAMAQVMSFVMTIFIIIPVLAPIVGQAVMLYFGWSAIFITFVVLAMIAGGWFAIRQPETLPKEQRVALSLSHIWYGIKETVQIRIAFGNTLIMGLIFGAFVGYLSSVQQIFQTTYKLGTDFPFYFAVVAISIGVASVINARLVIRYGMRYLSLSAMQVITSVSLLFVIISYLYGGVPPLWLFMIYCIVNFFCIGVLFGNLNSMAMEPLGHIAGTGAAVVGSLSTFISVPIGIFIGASYDGTVIPLISGFMMLGAMSLVLMHWVQRQASDIKEQI